MDKFFRWLTGNKQTTAATPAQDTANTAPLSEQQIQAIVSNQNPRFDLQQYKDQRADSLNFPPLSLS